MDIYVRRKDLRQGTKFYVCRQSKSYKLLIPNLYRSSIAITIDSHD